MKNSKIFIAVCVVAMAMLFIASPAKAGLLSDSLSFDGLVDTLDDDSEAVALDNDNNGIISVGDQILGVLRIGKTTHSGNLDADEQLIGIFAFEVTNVIANGGVGLHKVKYEMGATTGFLAGLLGGLDAQFGGNAIDDEAMMVVASNITTSDPTDVSFMDAVAQVNAGYLLEATAGKHASNADDFVEARLQDTDDNGEVSVAEILAYGTGDVGEEAGGLTILDQYGLGAGVTLLQVDADHLFPPGGVTQHDLAISGSIFGPNQESKDNGYQFRDSTSFAMNAVPEPASMAVWAAGLLCFAGASLRRRKK